ncbi:MAG: hypothetical protein KJ711_07680, partial [Candidatus Omnitrophica bacterium]|nr:hypothetical protein [Candidatus Omnitrophota bacterium]
KAGFLLAFLDISITKLSLPITPLFWIRKRIKFNSLSGISSKNNLLYFSCLSLPVLPKPR